MVKEFKDIGEQKNPYFKEACKHYAEYVTLLRQIAASNRPLQDDQMDVDSSPSLFKSQKYLFAYLQYLYDLIFIKTKDMQNQLCVQIIEPLVQIISTQPTNGVYVINLACQEEALKILKTITKRSHILDDQSLLPKIIDRLKVELQILKEDMSG